MAFLPLSRTTTTVFSVRSFGLLLLLLLLQNSNTKTNEGSDDTTGVYDAAGAEHYTTSGEPSEERPGDAKIFSYSNYCNFSSLQYVFDHVMI